MIPTPTNRDLAHLFVSNLPTKHARPVANYSVLDERHNDELADSLQDFIAEVISILIEAGSERDAVNEAEGLHDALVAELNTWSAPFTD